MSRIGFLGTGHIAAPMARALARQGHQVTVSERNADVAAELAAAGLGITVAPNDAVLAASDIVFLCLRPAIWEGIVTGLPWRPDHQIVSVMAGVPLEALAATCAPAERVSITIPLGFVEKGGCPLPFLGDPSALEATLGRDNPLLAQRDMDALTAHFAASTAISAALVAMQGAMDWLTAQTGDADQAEVYISTLLAGYLRDLPKAQAGDLAADLTGLASPKTLNVQMADAMRDARLPEAVAAAMTRMLAGMKS